MDIVKFPVLAGNMTVGQALECMKEEGISGIAVPMDHRVNLVGYGDLVFQRIPRRVKLANLEAIRVAPMIASPYARRLDLHPTPTMDIGRGELRKIENFLITSGYSFAAFGPMRRYASILSLHERNLDLFRLAPLDCYCSNIHRPHPYNRDHPPQCEYDGTPIVCS
jgi:hypothetical protein